MPQRQGNADYSPRRGAGNQVKIRSDGMVEMLFQLRQERRRKRAENAAPVNTQEAALLCPGRSSSPTNGASSSLHQPVPSQAAEATAAICRNSMHLARGLHSIRCDYQSVNVRF